MGDLEAVGMAAEATGNREAKQKTETEVSEMMRIKDSFQKVRWWTVIRLMSMAFFYCGPSASRGSYWLSRRGREHFSSPAQASRALFLAAQAGDERALLQIFGPDGKEIVSSGDPVEDKNSRDQFVRKYQEMKRLVEEPDGTVVAAFCPQ
jgi:Protein of unknown function (DUF2950)